MTRSVDDNGFDGLLQQPCQKNYRVQMLDTLVFDILTCLMIESLHVLVKMPDENSEMTNDCYGNSLQGNPALYYSFYKSKLKELPKSTTSVGLTTNAVSL